MTGPPAPTPGQTRRCADHPRPRRSIRLPHRGPPPDPSPEGAPQAQQAPLGPGGGAAVLIGLLLAGAGILGGAIWLDTTLHREQALTDYPDRPAPGRGTNWLLVGSDSRQGLSAEQQQDLATGGDVGSSRTDTILLVHVPEFWSSTQATMVSIPRDSYVPIPGHGKDKINAAFAMGGAPLLTQTVEQATGLRLDHYAEIGFSGFAGLVDALGGVTVCPTDADQRSVGRHRPAGRLPEVERPQRARIRPDARHTASGSGPDGQPTPVPVGAAAPRRQPGGVAQSVALVLGAACGRRRADRRPGRPCVGSGPTRLGAARIHHHADRADR